MRLVSIVLVILMVALGAAACGTGAPAEAASASLSAAVEAPPTYHGNVETILQNHCTKCHHDGGIAPFALTTYDQAYAMAPAISAATGSREMPPWGAQDTAECGPSLPWYGDERLSDAEIATLSAWATAGAVEGEQAVAPPAAPPNLTDLVSPTFELAPRTPYTPSTFDLDATDEYRCFVVDAPALEQGAFVSAIQVVPGRPEIVHHVSVFADVSGQVSASAGPDGSFPCSPGTSGDVEGTGALQLRTVVGWAPGGKPLELPPGVAIELPAGSKLLMQIHYSTVSSPAAPDLTKIQVRIADKQPQYVVESWGIGNYTSPLPNGDGLLPDADDTEFKIPANDPHHVESMQGTYGQIWGGDEPLRILGYRPHAHLAAVELKVDLVHADDGNDECMLQSQWDVHWQRVYTYDAAVGQMPLAKPGDRLRLRCTYDNTMANKRLGPVLRDNGLVPEDLYIGFTTLSEMCIVEVLLLRPYTPPSTDDDDED
jgi:hypothetical protein